MHPDLVRLVPDNDKAEPPLSLEVGDGAAVDELAEPATDGAEGVGLRPVVDEDGRVRATEEGRREGRKALLAGSIPDG